MTADQFFRISVLDGAFALVRHTSTYPALSLLEASKQLRTGPSHVASLDYERAQVALERFGRALFDASQDRQGDLRRVIYEIAVASRPFWALGAPFGRERSRQAMTEDTVQCFEYAGLLDDPPSQVAVEWWDGLAARFRNEGSERHREAGRQGEMLTLEYESQRLAQLGVTGRTPRWVAIEDNSAGYDVLSWERGDDGSLHELRIEAKAHSSFEARFFVSRNEWDIATLFSKSYVVYVWNLETKQLSRVLSVRELERHIPTDNGSGKWDVVRVSL